MTLAGWMSALMVVKIVMSLRGVRRVGYENAVQVPSFQRTARQVAGRCASCQSRPRLSQQRFGGITRNEASASDQNTAQLPRFNEMIDRRPSDSVYCAELADPKRPLFVRPNMNNRKTLSFHLLPLQFRIACSCT